MAYHGDIALGQTIDFQFNTFRFSTGAPFTLAGTPTLAAYVGNSITQITAGLTLTVDFDAKTGAHNVRCVATSGNGYAAATDVTIVLEAGTVDSVSVVGAVVGSFSIENRSALRPTVAARTLDVTATGAAGIDWANVENPTTALNLSATNIDVDQVVASVSGAVGSVTGTVTLAAATHTGAVIPTVTTLTNLPTIPANWLTAAGTAADFGAEIADAVWDEATAGHATAGTTGKALTDAGSAGDPWGTALPGAYGAGSAGKILGDNLDATVSSRATPTNITAATGVVLSGVTHTGAVIPTVTTLTGHTAQTGDSFARIGATGSGLTSLASQASVSTIDDFIDTEIADIQARLPAALTAGGNMKSDTLAINGNTTSAAVLAILNGATVVYQGTVTGAATTTTLVDSGLTAPDADFYKGRILIFTSGALTLQATDCTAFTPATDTITFTALTQAPSGGMTYVII